MTKAARHEYVSNRACKMGFSELQDGLAVRHAVSFPVLLLSMGSRGYVFIPALLVVIIRHYQVRNVRLVSLSAMAVLIFALVGVAGYFRDYCEAAVAIEPNRRLSSKASQRKPKHTSNSETR